MHQHTSKGGGALGINKNDMVNKLKISMKLDSKGAVQVLLAISLSTLVKKKRI